MENKFTITREHKGRTLTVRAEYNEKTDDWNVVLFEGSKAVDARATTNVWDEARDMLDLELDTPHAGHERQLRKENAMPRPLNWIAEDIRKTWSKPYFGAVPYLRAMLSLSDIRDDYGADSARSIVLYFLSNATTWRGPDARRIKAELKEILK